MLVTIRELAEEFGTTYTYVHNIIWGRAIEHKGTGCAACKDGSVRHVKLYDHDEVAQLIERVRESRSAKPSVKRRGLVIAWTRLQGRFHDRVKAAAEAKGMTMTAYVRTSLLATLLKEGF